MFVIILKVCPSLTIAGKARIGSYIRLDRNIVTLTNGLAYLTKVPICSVKSSCSSYSGACTIEHFAGVSSKLECFSLYVTSALFKYFEGRLLALLD